MEVVAFLSQGTAVLVETVGDQSAALLALKGQEQASGKACAVLVHQSSVQLLVSIENVPLRQAGKVIVFEAR